MTQPNLFDTPESLSPEAEWLKKHDVTIVQVTGRHEGFTFLFEPDYCWFAFVPFKCLSTTGIDSWWFMFQYEAFFAISAVIGNGENKDEAILEISRMNQWKTPMQERYQ